MVARRLLDQNNAVLHQVNGCQDWIVSDLDPAAVEQY